MALLTKRIFGISTVLICASIALSACSRENVNTANSAALSLACQTIKCKCLTAKDNAFGGLKSAKILWRPNGDATCPVGYSLQKSQRKRKKRNN